MVLGLRTKSRKCVSVQVEYLIHVQHVKPWPSGQTLKPDQCVLIQWENDQSSGSFKCGSGDDRIGVSESFKLPVTLFKEASKQKNSHGSFQKNLLEFNLYEYQIDKAVKGQLLGSAVINLGEYGATRETMNIRTPVNCKKGLKNVAQQPLLYVSIQVSDGDSCSSSPKAGTSRGKNGNGSISALDDEDYEIASFTDDDDDDAASTHSSQTTSSISQKDEQEKEASRKGKPESYREDTPSAGGVLSGNFHGVLQPETAENSQASIKSSSKASSPDVYARSKDPQNQEKTWTQETVTMEEAALRDLCIGPSNGIDGSGNQENGQTEQSLNAKKIVSGSELTPAFSRWGTRKHVTVKKAGFGEQDVIVKRNELKRAKSTFVSSGMEDNRELLLNIKAMTEARKNRAQKDDPKDSTVSVAGNMRKTIPSSYGDSKVESKVAMLEEELREAAVLEVSLYSVVAEHGSSSNKIHSPARRLYRFYFHACNPNSPTKRGNAARAVISGLTLVSRACGNDVARLTFWLSNAIILRGIVSQAAEKSEITSGARNGSKVYGGLQSKSAHEDDDWQDPQTLIIALERVEAWIFSRIVESIWWQTMTPHMQTSAAKGSSSRKPHGKRHILSDQEWGFLSVELWKKAFKDACERLCPVRAGGHECACLPVLARLVMEQLVSRLDVAMFNAILRESADEMPTDPVSDPISDSKVLPIAAGKSGFGAGAQLKNAIGSWSRWLSDIFGIDDDGHEGPNEPDGNKNQGHNASFKAFHLLNALSDLMMLPFEMMADRTTRKEICPAFGVPMIKRVLYNFVPDEFCPDPVPTYVFEALDTEDQISADEEPISDIPYVAPTTIYTPPTASSFMSMIGDIGSQSASGKSSALKKSYTSDDELDVLDSPMTSIILDKGRVSPASALPNWTSKGKESRKVVRYQLLREVWQDGE